MTRRDPRTNIGISKPFYGLSAQNFLRLRTVTCMRNSALTKFFFFATTGWFLRTRSHMYMQSHMQSKAPITGIHYSLCICWHREHVQYTHDVQTQLITCTIKCTYVTRSGKRWNSAQKFKMELRVPFKSALRVLYDGANHAFVAFSYHVLQAQAL